MCQKEFRKFGLNTLLHRLFLDHDIIVYFKTMLKKIKQNLSEVLNTFENIMENEALLKKSKCSIFHNIFKYMIFQRHQKALLWGKELNRWQQPVKKVPKDQQLIMRDDNLQDNFRLITKISH